MQEDKRRCAVDNVIDAQERICRDFNEKFGDKIGNIDTEPERERIFILEEMLQNAQKLTNESFLRYTQELIESIDEQELIERKKANMQQRG